MSLDSKKVIDTVKGYISKGFNTSDAITKTSEEFDIEESSVEVCYTLENGL